MRRVAAFASLFLGAALMPLLSACGGGGGGGSGIAERSLYWGVPLLGETLESGPTTIGLRTLENDGVTVTLLGYRPDGTPYTGPVMVELDGLDEAHLSASSALGGDVPDGGWVLVTSTSDALEVFFEVEHAPEVETSRASQLPDLAAPPPVNRAGLTVHFLTQAIHVSNASGAANLITVVPFEEPGGDPGLPPIEHPPVPILFAPFETKVFDADGLSGVTGFVGSFAFEAPFPFFVAAIEDFVAFDVQTSLEVREDLMPSRVTSTVALRFGREDGPIADNWFDFVLVARNDSEDVETVTVESIYDELGTPLLDSARVISLDPHESRVEGTDGLLFGDVLGDVFLETGVRWVQVRVTHGPETNVSFRQFDPAGLAYAMTLKDVPEGHVFDVADLQGAFPDLLDVIVVSNPTDDEISVDVSALIPEPEGFDASPLLLETLVLAPRTIQVIVVDGTFLDRDLEPVSFVGFRLTSISPFGVTAHRERRGGVDLITYLTPRLVANHEVAVDY
jgi:hypothetical protein